MEVATLKLVGREVTVSFSFQDGWTGMEGWGYRSSLKFLPSEV